MSTAVPASSDWTTQVAPVLEFIRKSLWYTDEAAHKNILKDAKKSLISYPADVLQRIGSAHGGKDDASHRLSHLILIGRRPEYVDEAFRFLPKMDTAMSRAEYALGALHSYKQLPQCRNFAAESALVQDQCLAIMIVTIALENEFESIVPAPLQWIEYEDQSLELPDMYPVIEDDRLTDLVLKNPERAPVIADMIRKRRTADAELLEMLLDNASDALAEGLL